MEARPEIVNDQEIIDAWLRDDSGRTEQRRKSRVNHGSKIGHPCDRYLVLLRTHGDHATPPSQRLKAIFKRGNVLEQPVAVQQLIRAGWRTWDEQRQFDLVEKGDVILSCTLDCLAKPPGSSNTFVVDHKVINPYDWEKIPRGWDGYDFLRNSEKVWLQAWPAQLMSYMYVHPGSAEVGLLQLINAETLLPKFVYIPFDVEYMQWIIDRGHRLNAYYADVMKRGLVALPPAIEWDEGVCGRCELLGTCLPDQLGRKPLELIEDESFVELLELDRELAAQKKGLEKEYEKVHDRVRHMVGEREQVAAGRFVVTTKRIETKPYTVAAKTYLRMDIKELAPKEVDADDAGAA